MARRLCSAGSRTRTLQRFSRSGFLHQNSESLENLHQGAREVLLPSRQLASGPPASGTTSDVILKRRDRIYAKCCAPLDEFNNIESSFATFDFGDEGLRVSNAFCERGLSDVCPLPQITQEG